MEYHLNQIIYKDINNNFGYGNYEGFVVIIMKKDSYVNITKLCNKHGKNFDHWKQNTDNQNLIKEVEKKDKSFITIKRRSRSYKICGTYAHELLLPHIICWIWPPFVLKISKIVNQLAVINDLSDSESDSDDDIIEPNNNPNVNHLIDSIISSDTDDEPNNNNISTINRNIMISSSDSEVEPTNNNMITTNPIVIEPNISTSSDSDSDPDDRNNDSLINYQLGVSRDMLNNRSRFERIIDSIANNTTDIHRIIKNINNKLDIMTAKLDRLIIQ